MLQRGTAGRLCPGSVGSPWELSPWSSWKEPFEKQVAQREWLKAKKEVSQLCHGVRLPSPKGLTKQRLPLQ